MNTETIQVGNRSVLTLREYVSPGLKAIFVGINPSPVSVSIGHYYQGKLGKRFWSRLREFEIIFDLPSSKEDLHACNKGFGFADISRVPTARSHQLSRQDKKLAAVGFVEKLRRLPDRPLIIFVFSEAAKLSETLLNSEGFKTYKMPGPFAKRSEVEVKMHQLKSLLSE